MKRFLLILLAPLLFLSCEKELEEPDAKPLTMSEISGSRLWERISSEADFKSYGEWPGHEGLRQGQAPHGSWHTVYTNKVLREALPLDGLAPDGTIIVKENFTPSKELDKLTVMAKVKGYDPENNDWYWAAFSPEGKVLAEGSPAGCLSCHSGRRDNDFVIIKNLDTPLSN